MGVKHGLRILRLKNCKCICSNLWKRNHEENDTTSIAMKTSVSNKPTLKTLRLIKLSQIQLWI